MSEFCTVFRKWWKCIWRRGLRQLTGKQRHRVVPGFHFVEQACQPVRQRCVDSWHDELCGRLDSKVKTRFDRAKIGKRTDRPGGLSPRWERTRRSALPPRDCRVHSNGSLGLDAQRLRTSEFDSATAHRVRSTSCGPEGAQEGSRGFRNSGTPGQPSPTQPKPRQGFQRARHNALLPSSAPQQAAPAASVQ